MTKPRTLTHREAVYAQWVREALGEKANDVIVEFGRLVQSLSRLRKENRELRSRLKGKQ